MKLFELNMLNRFLVFAVLCFLICDLLLYGIKEWKRVGKLEKEGILVDGTFTELSAKLEKRKMKCTARITYYTKDNQCFTDIWQKGFFDEEVLIFRNTDKKKLNVHVRYDAEKPGNMYVVECYNRKKHILIMALCIIAVCAFGYMLIIL